MQGEYRTKFILALLGHACLGLSSKKCELLSEANDGQNQINLIFTKNDKTNIKNIKKNYFDIFILRSIYKYVYIILYRLISF